MDFYNFQQNRYTKNGWRRYLRIYGILGIAGLLIISAIYAVAVSKIFKVKVYISGLQRLTEQQFLHSVAAEVFQNRLKGFLGLDNYFTWPSDLILKEPLIASISVDKRLFEKKIFVKVTERQPYGVWCLDSSGSIRVAEDQRSKTGFSCAWFDNQGILFELAPIPEGYLILRIDSDSARPLILGTPVIKPELYGNIYSLLGFFTNSRLTVEHYLVKEQLQEFHLQINNGPQIRFSYRFDPKNALDAIKLLMDKEEWKKTDYIDLTVENRVYLR